MSNTWTILWVEDDHENLDAALLPVTRQGVKVVGCSSFIEAQTRLETETYDLFLIDLILPLQPYNEETATAHDDAQEKHLPWYWGVELIKFVREKYTSTPVIVFSVVYDPIVNATLTEIGIEASYTKGTQSNSELCDKIVELCKRETKA